MMNGKDKNELTSAERAAFAALPSERDPGSLLEERTVRALRGRGLLRPSGRRWLFWRVPRLAAAVAASITLFVTGIAVGQWLGSRAVAGPMAQVQRQTALQAAAAVQRAGSAYVNALTVLATHADSSENGAIEQGREAALTALYAAAYELSLLAPDDPIAVAIRERLEKSELSASGQSNARFARVTWF